MVTTRKSLTSFEVDYDFYSFPLGYGSAQGRVRISNNVASWDNGVITVTENKTSIKPTIYSSLKDASDRQQPLKPIDSSEYVPLATITVTNIQEPNRNSSLYNPGQIPLDSTINLSTTGGIQNINFAPLKIQRIYIGFKDYLGRVNNVYNDTVVFPNVSSYQNIKIGNSDLYFGYVGAVEGKPKSISKDELLVLGGTAGNIAILNDGQTKTFTLYGRLFAVDTFDPITITSISEDTGLKGDFRTSDNTLIFNGKAEAGSKVEVFLDNKSIGIAYANAQGNWVHNYSQVKLPDKSYTLTAAETNVFGEIKTAVPTTLEIDTDYDIELDFSDPSVIDNLTLQNQIKKAAEYWEGIILNDIPDVKDSNVGDPKKGGLIDDLKIKFVIGTVDNKGGVLAFASMYDSKRVSLPRNSVDPLTGQPLSSFNYLPSSALIVIDSADLSDIMNTNFGLQTLQHEIAHAIGFNSQTFADKGLVKNVGGNHYGFTAKGNNALLAYHALGGKLSHTSVPLEDKPNPGHWNEWLFPDGQGEYRSFPSPPIAGQDELMTTSTPRGSGDAILSKLTLGAFQDLGFSVDLNKGADLKINQGGTVIDIFKGTLPYINPLFDINY